MGRRAGRKRKQVDRHPCGQTVKVRLVGTEDERTAYMNNLVVTLEDKKTTATRSRLSVLEAMGISGGPLEAGKELERLWHLCRKYATDAPSINAKVSSLHRGTHGHEGDQSEDVVAFGVKVHSKYQAGIRVVSAAHGRGAVKAIVAACIENETLTDGGKDLCRLGLVALADELNY
jgi:hypothetical protein